MAVHMLRAIQRIPGNPGQIWEFFSNPANLAKITPVEMDFRVISDKWEKEIYPGQIIEYKVRPVFNIPFYWMTEITQVQAPTFFIDEQRRGPYSLWHHQHHFAIIEGGVEMTDIVHYSSPLGFLGEIANVILVKKKLRELFEYRVNKIEEKFGKMLEATITMR